MKENKPLVGAEQRHGVVPNILRITQHAKRYALRRTGPKANHSLIECLESIEAEAAKVLALNQDYSREVQWQQRYEELNEHYHEAIEALRGLLFGPGDGFGHNSRQERMAAIDAIAKADAKIISSSK
jgi:hypothetical protein